MDCLHNAVLVALLSMISTEPGQDHPPCHSNVVANADFLAENITVDNHDPALPKGCLKTPSRSSSTSSSFEELLSTTPLPPPGPAHYAARRALWLAPPPVPPAAPEPSSSNHRLEQLLSQPGGIESEAVWKGGIEKVWRGLVAGGRLKRRLPMCIVIIHAGWIRDPDTWPVGAVAPEPDDILDAEVLPVQRPVCSTLPGVASAECSSEVTSPWMPVEPPQEHERAAGMVAEADH